MLLLRWLERHGAPRLASATLPHGNHLLPDLLRLGGVRELLLDSAPAGCLRWEGAGGARLMVRRSGDQTPDEDARLHWGALPALAGFQGWNADTILSLYELARLEDAMALVGSGGGAAWDGLLAAGGWAEVGAAPPPQPVDPLCAGLGAWNPLPLDRPCLVTLTPNAPRAPWSVGDDSGARHPVQGIDTPLGPAWLVQLRLGPLASTHLVARDEPVPGAHWEVSAQVLDNGIVRAELDALGQIARLCWDGVFADLAGPACAPCLDGLPMSGPATITVLETGPVRARVRVQREAQGGRLELTYTLHAGEDHLRVAATWAGDGACWLDHATAQRAADLLLSVEGARWRVVQAASAIVPPMEPTPGVRWACLADSAGRGLALCAGRPICVHGHAGHLRVLAGPGASWALAAPRRVPGALSLGQLAEHLCLPGHHLTTRTIPPSPFRLVELGSLVPLWARRCDATTGELLLAEQAGVRCRAWLLPSVPPTAEAVCRKVDARGETIAPCPPSPEGDGWQIDAAPGEVLLVRWRI